MSLWQVTPALNGMAMDNPTLVEAKDRNSAAAIVLAKRQELKQFKFHVLPVRQPSVAELFKNLEPPNGN